MMGRQSYQHCTQTKGIIKLPSDALFIDMHLPAITKLLIVTLFFFFYPIMKHNLAYAAQILKRHSLLQ